MKKKMILPDPKEFSANILRREGRKVFKRAIFGLIFFIAFGALSGVVFGRIIEGFSLSGATVENALLFIYVLSAIILGYCFYRYVKAALEDDDGI
jgi:hypothetical protein